MKLQHAAWAFAAMTALALAPSRTDAGCTDGVTFVTAVDRTFTAGSQFKFDIRRSNCSGLDFAIISYKPKGGTLMQVLNRAYIAEIHVPYNKGVPRFLDISVDTAGLGANAVALAADECDGGTRFDGNRICVRNADEGYGWKFGTSFRKAEAIEVFMSSQLGRYNYVNKWTFHDDGHIEPALGLTGQLQVISTGAGYLPFGARVNPESSPTVLVGADHQHNVYYRLDFDINGAGGDVVSRRLLAGSTLASPDSSCATFGQCTRVSFTPITAEQAQTWNASGQTTWLIQDKNTLNSDGRRIGYEVLPHVTGLWRGMTSTTEPYAGSDLWVTAFNSCEILAVGNAPPQIPASCSGAASNVQAMLSSQPTDGADVVVWYVNRFAHHTRDEDQTNMPIEWMSFEISPVSFFASNPAARTIARTVPATVKPLGAPQP